MHDMQHVDKQSFDRYEIQNCSDYDNGTAAGHSVRERKRADFVSNHHSKH